MKRKGVILFSGGLDSTTALYWGKAQFDLTALIFDYGQKHSIEVRMAEEIARQNQIPSVILKLDFKDIIISALTDSDRDIPESLAASKDSRGVPFTYVPFRNGIFLSYAAAFGESHQSYDIITGFNVIDTPDYPDTTSQFTSKMEEVINCGTAVKLTGNEFIIHTPLIQRNKKEIIELGLALGADYSYSISCYRGSEIPCRRCPSCDIRKAAFDNLGIMDPLMKRLKNEGKI